MRATRILLPLFRHSLLIGLSFVILYPVLFMLTNSFMPHEQLRDPSVVWLPRSLTLQNFRDIMEVMDYFGALINTVLYTVMPTFLQIGVCLMVGYGFARFRFPFKNFLFGLVILTVIIPPISLSTGLFRIFFNFNPLGILGFLHWATGGAVPESVNLIGSRVVTFIPAAFAASLRSGIYILIFRQFFASMPKELEEASRIDGAGPFRIFSSVMLPNATNIALTTLMLAIVWNWNDFYTAATYLRPRATIATSLSEVQSLLQNLPSVLGGYTNLTIVTTRIQAACLLGIAPLLLMYVFLQDKLAESIESAGLTGM